jgi:hypothetical protein
MPTPEKWVENLWTHGFDVDLDTDFDVRDFFRIPSLQVQGA